MKMKKISLALTMALMCTLCSTVNAEESGYVPGVNSFTNSITNGAKTVMIYKGTESSDITSENIYYIGQSNDAEGFSNLEMLMKLDAPAGEYTVLVNGGNSIKFAISDAEAFVSGGTKIDFLGTQMRGENSYSVAFGVNAKNLYNDTPQVTMIIGDKAFTTDLNGNNSIINWGTAVQIAENEVMFALQIDGVGKEYINTDESGECTPGFDLYVK